MGMVHAIQKGSLSPEHVGAKVRDAAKKMKPSDAKDFAATKTKDLPEHVEKKAETAPTGSQPPQPSTAGTPATASTPSTPANDATKQANLTLANDLIEAAERATCEAAHQVKQAARYIERLNALGLGDEELAKRASAVDTVVRAAFITG